MSLPAGKYQVDFLQEGALVQSADIEVLANEEPAIDPVELRTNATHIQWRGQGGNTWADLIPLEEIGGGGSGSGHFITTEDFAISPSGDPATDRANLQAFIDSLRDTNLRGLIKAGTWQLDRTLKIYDGIRLHGEGMEDTILECMTDAWNSEGFDGIEAEYSSNIDVKTRGIHLYDLQVIGADKDASGDGGLITLNGVHDFRLERVKGVDGSDACIRVTGYGKGNFTNDITSEFWNSTQRGIIRDCVVVRGRVGIELEGGVEAATVENNACYDNGLHGIRVPSAYNCNIRGNHIYRTENAIWVDRHRDIVLSQNFIKDSQRGVVYGGFATDGTNDAGFQSHGLIIDSNIIYARTSLITDAYQGTDTKNTDGVTITNNHFYAIDSDGSASIRMLWTKNLIIQGNVGFGINGHDATIHTSHATTGMCANNWMYVLSLADGMVDGGNNIDPVDYA